MSRGKPDTDTRFCTMRREGNRLAPVSAYDSEILNAFDQGVDIEVTFKMRRSNPQHRLYWKMLSRVVKATEGFASPKHLHEEIKIALGYRKKKISAFTNIPYFEADSTAFSAMDGSEFKVFFDRAIQLLAEETQINPLDFYDEMDNRNAA